MQHHLIWEAKAILPYLIVNHAILSRAGEDSFAVLTREDGSGMVCVADGCGGLGSRRYPLLKGHTGAYAASRLAARTMKQWATKGLSCPVSAMEGVRLQLDLQLGFEKQFQRFAQKNQMEAGRIVGSMQRILPTTLCGLLHGLNGTQADGCFLWAGDSRGCVLDAQGLHQYTQDDVKSPLDVLDRLYGDSALSLCLSADHPIRLHLRRFSVETPCLLITLTDGGYSCLPTPMELEMMLLSTMDAASDMASWQRKLGSALRKLSHDDATVVIAPIGFDSFDRMKAFYSQRKQHLEEHFIRPVRLSGCDRETARRCWQEYRPQYERWEVTGNGTDDWRL